MPSCSRSTRSSRSSGRRSSWSMTRWGSCRGSAHSRRILSRSRPALPLLPHCRNTSVARFGLRGRPGSPAPLRILVRTMTLGYVVVDHPATWPLAVAGAAANMESPPRLRARDGYVFDGVGPPARQTRFRPALLARYRAASAAASSSSSVSPSLHMLTPKLTVMDKSPALVGIGLPATAARIRS